MTAGTKRCKINLKGNPISTKSSFWRCRTLYLMLIPGLIFYGIFRYGPYYGSIISFKDFYIMQGIMKSPWANPWFKHFSFFFNSPYFMQLIRNTLLISLYKMFWGTIFSIFLAIALNEVRIKIFKKTIQTLTYMPYFLSWVVIYGITCALFSQSFGLINSWIKEAFGATIPFLISTKWFRTILVGSEIWKSTGWGAIIYLAAIAGIDPNLYEAAEMDGASRIRMIWYITLPSIRSIIIILLILRLGRILDAGFEQVYIMYNILVYSVADILDTWVFRTGLQQWNFSLASAVGLFKSIIAVILVLGVNKIAKIWGESLW